MKRIAIILVFCQTLGMAASSLNFNPDGGSDRVDYGTLGSLNPTKVTYMLWVKPTTVIAGGRGLASKDVTSGASTTGYALRWNNPNGTLSVLANRTSQSYSSGNLGCTASNWCFVAIVSDQAGSAGALHKFYVGFSTADVQQTTYGANTDGSGGYANLSTFPIRLGNRTGNNNAQDGLLAHFAFVDSILTRDQIAEWMWTGTPPANMKIINEVGFNDTGTQYDLSGSGNTGTQTGTAVSSDGPPIFFPQGVM